MLRICKPDPEHRLFLRFYGLATMVSGIVGLIAVLAVYHSRQDCTRNLDFADYVRSQGCSIPSNASSYSEEARLFRPCMIDCSMNTANASATDLVMRYDDGEFTPPPFLLQPVLLSLLGATGALFLSCVAARYSVNYRGKCCNRVVRYRDAAVVAKRPRGSSLTADVSS